ncbi:MAG: AraC family transcriptional regulator [Acidobacteria bacterium]|nr:AraC family transcriptional regulator [Acidobacteriota bacterium]MBI3422847.1 AraC family transcriptional regulator [Acidobacteriota bacterium]
MRSYNYLPSAPLNDFIASFWHLEDWNLPHQHERVLPTGTMELVIDLNPAHSATQTPLLSGIFSQPSTIGIAPQTTMIGVNFKPGGAGPFLRVPGAELHNQRILLNEFWGPEAAFLRERLLMLPSVEARFAVLEQNLLAKFDQAWRLHPAVAFALREFQRADQQPAVAEVTEQTGYSNRHFIQLFHEQVGLTPKLFCRVQRFQQTLSALNTARPIDWAELAITLSYFDQAHLINEFRAFAGLSPTAWLARRGENPNHLPLFD